MARIWIDIESLDSNRRASWELVSLNICCGFDNNPLDCDRQIILGGEFGNEGDRLPGVLSSVGLENCHNVFGFEIGSGFSVGIAAIVTASSDERYSNQLGSQESQ